MFIKKYVKGDKITFMLVMVEQVSRDNVEFHNYFINEELANALSKFGITIKEK